MVLSVCSQWDFVMRLPDVHCGRIGLIGSNLSKMGFIDYRILVLTQLIRLAMRKIGGNKRNT